MAKHNTEQGQQAGLLGCTHSSAAGAHASPPASYQQCCLHQLLAYAAAHKLSPNTCLNDRAIARNSREEDVDTCNQSSFQSKAQAACRPLPDEQGGGGGGGGGSEQEACLRGLQVVHRDCVASGSAFALLLLLLLYQHPRLRKRVCFGGAGSGASTSPLPPASQTDLLTRQAQVTRHAC